MTRGSRPFSWGLQFIASLILLHTLSLELSGWQQELRAGSTAFIYWPGFESVAKALADGAAVAPPMPGLDENILAYGRIEVYLAPDQAVFDSLAPGMPDWVAGIAFPQGDRIVLPTFGPHIGGVPVASVLRHELAHVALERYLGSRVPRWFHEGYAQLAAGSWHSEDAWALRAAILMRQVPSLDAISLGFDRERMSTEHAYLLGYTAVEYLYRIGGSDGFARLLEHWRESGSLDTALRRTYGLTLWQFERLWRRRVRDQYGWLLLASQTTVFWATLTIALLGLGYWKRRRNVSKLAALEAAVQATELSRLHPDEDEAGWARDPEIDENQGGA